MTNVAIVLAGGAGTRLHASENKVYLPVAGRPLLAWSLEAFDRSDSIDRIVLVIREADTERANDMLAAHPVRKLDTIVPGGSTRHESEHAGIEALAPAIERGEIGLVCVHDGARPFIRQALIEEIMQTAAAHGGAVPSLLLETPVLVRAGTGAASPPEPVATHDLRRVQTPQAFRARPLLRAHRQATADGLQGMDTTTPVTRYTDLVVKVVDGDADNIKVTFVEDLFAVEELAARWQDSDEER